MGWDNVVIWTRILLVCGLGYYSYLGYTITVSRRRQGSYHGWDIHAFIPCHLRLNRSSSAQCTGAARPNVQEQLSPMYRSSSAQCTGAARPNVQEQLSPMYRSSSAQCTGAARPDVLSVQCTFECARSLGQTCLSVTV